MSNPQQSTAGGKKQPGMTIGIEGPYRSLIGAVSEIVASRLDDTQTVVRDTSLQTNDERIISANQRLLDSAATGMAPETTSLMVAVKLQQRLKACQAYRTQGAFVISNTSWLEDAAYYSTLGNTPVADRILNDYATLRHDVWVVIDLEDGVYAQLARRAGVQVISADLSAETIAAQITEAIDAYQRAASAPEQQEKQVPVSPKLSTNTLMLIDCAHHGLPHSGYATKKDGTVRYGEPEGISPKVIRAYRTIMNKLMQNHHTAAKRRLSDAEDLLPLASMVCIEDGGRVQRSNAALSLVVGELLPEIIDGDSEPSLHLLRADPKTEYESIAWASYPLTNRSLEALRGDVMNLAYDEKLQLLKAVHHDSPNTPVVYQFEVLATNRELEILALQEGITISAQPRTPRYGYDIRDEHSSELFQQSYDLSLELYSLMQAAGYHGQAEAAVLLGHRTRAIVTASYASLASVEIAETTELYANLRQLAADAHPLLFQ